MLNLHPKDKELLTYGLIVGIALTILNYFVVVYNISEEIVK